MNILFLCVGNSGRSQIAEGLAKDMLPKNYDIKSAGSIPAKVVHKDAVAVMNEIGIDISPNQTKSIDDIDENFINELDYVITLCAEEVCPVVPKTTNTLHWPNADPDNNNYDRAHSLRAFRKARDDIFKLLKKFILEKNI